MCCLALAASMRQKNHGDADPISFLPNFLQPRIVQREAVSQGIHPENLATPQYPTYRPDRQVPPFAEGRFLHRTSGRYGPPHLGKLRALRLLAVLQIESPHPVRTDALPTMIAIRTFSPEIQ